MTTNERMVAHTSTFKAAQAATECQHELWIERAPEHCGAKAYHRGKTLGHIIVLQDKTIDDEDVVEAVTAFLQRAHEEDAAAAEE